MSDSEDSVVATSNPPAASAVKSKNSKGTRKPPAKRNPVDKAVRGTVADQLKKKPKEVRKSIFKVSRRKSMNRDVFLTQTAEAVDLMQEAFKGIRDGVGKWNETAHFIKICGEILTPIEEFHFALGGKARRHPAKAPPQKKPPVPGRVDATAATKVVCIEEKPLVPVADESKSESSSDDENEDDVDESSQDEEEEEDDEEECNLAGRTRPAKDGASSAAPLRVEDDDGAPPASSLQPRVARPPRVEPSSSPQRKAVAPPTDDDDDGAPPAASLQPRVAPPPRVEPSSSLKRKAVAPPTDDDDEGGPPAACFKKIASAAANLAGQAAVAAVGLTLQGAAAASGLTLKGAAAASGYALHGAVAASGLALHGAAAGGNMVVRQVAAAMTAPQPQAPAPGQDQGHKRKRFVTDLDMWS